MLHIFFDHIKYFIIKKKEKYKTREKEFINVQLLYHGQNIIVHILPQEMVREQSTRAYRGKSPFFLNIYAKAKRQNIHLFPQVIFSQFV